MFYETFPKNFIYKTKLKKCLSNFLLISFVKFSFFLSCSSNFVEPSKSEVDFKFLLEMASSSDEFSSEVRIFSSDDDDGLDDAVLKGLDKDGLAAVIKGLDRKMTGIPKPGEAKKKVSKQEEMKKQFLEAAKEKKNPSRPSQLKPKSKSLFDDGGLKAASNEVEIEATLVLDDVVKGGYGIPDLHRAREGLEAAKAKDPIQNSPVQLLDNVLEDFVKQTRTKLKPKELGQFFESQPPGTQDVIPPEQRRNAIERSTTAVELVLGKSLSTDDASDAFMSYILSVSMTEAEDKVNKSQGEAHLREDEINKSAASTNTAATTAAVASGAPAPNIVPGTVVPGFNVSNLTLDVSFLPSRDPNIYKPLEIISYIGMTSLPLQ